MALTKIAISMVAGLQAALSALGSFTRSAVGAVMRSLQDKLGERVTLADFGGGPERTAAQNDSAFVAALAHLKLVGGGTLRLGTGDHLVSQTIFSDADNVHLKLSHGTGILYVTANYTALKLVGTNCRVTGGLGRGFIGPAGWDGTNTSPSYGVLWMGGSGAYVRTRLVNVRQVGIWFKEAMDCHADGCYIDGTYPSGQWTGIETMHYGIAVDPDGVGASGGNYKVTGCTIKGCVQGVFAGNYASGGIIRGLVITGNIFEGCWNHGVYCNYTNGAVITGNSFNRCQLPVAAGGRHNNISGNTMYTAVDTVGDQRDIVGISLRDPSFCVVANNTIKGTVEPAAAVVINLQYFAQVTGGLEGNVVSGNVIEITGGSANAIRITGQSVYGTANITDNHISDNTIKGTFNEDGAILLDGIASGSNTANSITNNTLVMLAGVYGVKATNMFAADVSGNTVEWRYDAGALVNVYTVALGGTCQYATVSGNASVCTFQWGANLQIYGLREFSTSNNNSCFNNHDKVLTTKAPAMIKIWPLVGSQMDVQETGPSVPSFAPRCGSTWRRYPFGGPGAALYVFDGTNWVSAT